MRSPASLIALLIIVTLVAQPVATQRTLELGEPVNVTALAVGLTERGEVVGSSATITVTVARNGSGHVFIDTRPLTGTDMQGSARIAARVAAGLTGLPLEQYDLFFVVRSPSEIIAGPSAGGIMALAAVVALKNAELGPGEQPWAIDDRVMSTGTIGPDGSIGPVGGILEKAQAAQRQGARLFLVPEGQLVVPRLEQVGGAVVPGEIVDLEAHCQQELAITCQQVAGIEELVELATGHRLGVETTDPPPSTSQYVDTLGPLADALVEDALVYRDTWRELNRTDDIQVAGERATNEALETAHGFAQQALTHIAAEEFYSAASRAFSASIHAREARLLLEFFTEGRSLDQVETFLREAADDVRTAQAAAAEAEVDGMVSLYTVGAAQERVSDAEAHLADAWAALNGTDLSGALFNVAWAVERAGTVHWWLSLSGPFGPGPPLPVDVEDLAVDFVDLAAEMLVYAGEVLQLPGGPERATVKLSQARADQARGFHAAALLEAAESQVISTLSIELQPGTITQDKVNASRDRAAAAIQQARAIGVEPILPVAFFEFAAAQDDPAIGLEFYREASVFAGFSTVLAGESDPAPSRFVGGFDDPAPTQTVAFQSVFRQVAVGWFTLGFLMTLTLVVFAAALTRTKRGS